MSTEQIPGQMSMTAGEIRDALDRMEAGYPTDPAWTRPMKMVEEAKRIRDLADRLIAEEVAGARSVEHPSQRVRLDKAGDAGDVDLSRDRLTLVEHGTARDKRMYGWDVIGWVLGISGEAARQRYGR